MKGILEEIVSRACEDLYRFALCLTGEEEYSRNLVEQAFKSRLQSGISALEIDTAIKSLFSRVYRLFLATESPSQPEVGPSAPPLVTAGPGANEKDLGESQLPPVVDSVDDLLKLSHEDILTAFWDVPPTYRPALALYYIGRFSLSEIADILDTDIETVQYRILYGKEMLNRALSAKIAARSRKILLHESNNERPSA